MWCVAFQDDNIVHVEGKVGPVLTKEIIDAELQLKDLESVDKKKIQRIDKTARVSDAGPKPSLKCSGNTTKAVLESGKSTRSLNIPPADRGRSHWRPAAAHRKTGIVCSQCGWASMLTGMLILKAERDSAGRRRYRAVQYGSQIAESASRRATLFLEEFELPESAA